MNELIADVKNDSDREGMSDVKLVPLMDEKDYELANTALKHKMSVEEEFLDSEEKNAVEWKVRSSQHELGKVGC